ncbi:MAG: ribonuclease J [Clostridia bacterium]|nr:ribonuclease J [Clostridia bacterium]
MNTETKTTTTTTKKTPSVKKTTEKKTTQRKTTARQYTKTPRKTAPKVKKSPLKLIPLGGLDEIGKNMTAIEYADEIILVDCGMSFPDDDMPGIDLVINDITYLEKNHDKIKAVFLTHGHEDHIGGLPYFLKAINVPVYGTRLTLGLVEHKLKEHNLLSSVKLIRQRPGETVSLGSNFKVEFIRTNHSIADSVALAIKTPQGTVVHMGDFKIDTTPIVGDMIDLGRLGELGKEGVLALLSDSTNVERPGYAMSEKTVGDTFQRLFENCKKRIIVATFASNVHRVQQIIDAAAKNGRKVAVSGRSMENIVELSILLGYMKVPEGVLISLDNINKYRPSQVVIITTGSQGEPMSALTRMAYSDHRKVEITQNDLVIISATPIPGNEKAVTNVINELFKIGAEVIYKSLVDVHVSGHACQEELKMILALTKPKHFIPVHGEHRHLLLHAKLAEDMGINSTFVLSNGSVMEFDSGKAKVVGTVPSGKILVDGLGVGDVGNVVLKDRKLLAQDGLIIATIAISRFTGEILRQPEIISRGFVYVKESEELMDNIKKVVRESVSKYARGANFDRTYLRNNVRSSISRYIFETTRRSPVILPIIMEV